MRYQHAASERDVEIAGLLSKMAGGSVTPISKSATRKRKSKIA